ncbi:MAG TPA: hypothetical protein VEH84_17390 [Alphaproteobacteria bacterium]|nr:hypothetical protein [Alphaproteobacteria bacterium]
MGKGGTFTGWLIPAEERRRLLALFPPRYPDAVAEHVTLRFGDPKAPAPPPAAGRIVGIADDGRGVQALVVEIDGTTRRPDGGTYHITWSLDRAAGRKPVHSNDVLHSRGWQAVTPEPVALEPRRFPE